MIVVNLKCDVCGLEDKDVWYNVDYHGTILCGVCHRESLLRCNT